MRQAELKKKGVTRLIVIAVLSLLTVKAAPAQPKQDEAALATGDTIKVVVYSRPEISGPYLIGTDGCIRMPVVGTVPLAGMDMGSAGQKLQRLMSDALDYKASVTVDMARYRPVYVVGAVKDPGEHEYTPGLRVMQAVARAGGVAAAANGEAGIVQVLRARKSLVSALLDVQMLSVRQAALSQGLDGVERLELPKYLDNATDTPLLRSLLNEQQSLLDIGRRGVQETRTYAEREKRQIDTGIDALTAQQEALSSQLVLVARDSRSVQSLRDQGLATSMRMLSLNQMESDIRVSLNRISENLSRAHLTKVQLDQRVQSEETAWRKDLLDQKAKASSDLAKAQSDLETARQEALVAAGALVSQPSQLPFPTDVEFILSRTDKNGLVQRPIRPDAVLQAGDVLQVNFREHLTAGATESNHVADPAAKTGLTRGDSQKVDLRLHRESAGSVTAR